MSAKPDAQWVPLRVYCETYSLDRRTVQKYAAAGLIRIERITLKGHRPVLRVQNRPPWPKPVSIPG